MLGPSISHPVYNIDGEKNNPRTVCAKLLRNERNGERIYEISYTAKAISP